MSYLEDFLETVATLPIDVTRNFNLIRELDQRTQKLTEELKDLSREYFTKLRRVKKDNGEVLEEDKKVLSEIKTKQQTCLSLANEKIQIAKQTYAAVESHIQNLDKKIEKFDQELQDQGVDMSIADELNYDSQPNPPKKKRKLEPSAKVASKGGVRSKFEANNFKKARINTYEEDSYAEPSYYQHQPPQQQTTMQPLNNMYNTMMQPVIEKAHEPTYCVCKRISFGTMIGCDNDDCPIAWFHLDCVGLKEAPGGTWFCPVCVKNNRKK